MKRSARQQMLAVLALALMACGTAISSTPSGRTPTVKNHGDALASLDALDATVAKLEASPNPLSGKELGGVVSALGVAVGPISQAARLRLEQVASRFTASPVRSLSRSGWLKQALQLVIDALVPLTVTASEAPRVQQAVRRLGAARDQLDELLLLEDQRPRMGQALEAATNAVFVARGGTEPFSVAGATPSPPTPLGSYTQELAETRRAVGSVARIPLMGTRAASAEVLLRLADMLQVIDPSGRTQTHRQELRFQAERLQRAAETAHGQAGWIRAGLSAAVEALLLLAGSERSTWSDEAERAVAGIDRTSPPSFQRAAIQDAFRATVDAFAASLPSPEAPASGASK